ncbi:alpha/beta fold hydrolase [Hoyosella altamirensis]|uniref:alpha/beta fold hydrolase n=1 Tax=Hoyosella altamirensis TaxID=616997 RepID=UPI0007DB1DAB|nr:alpha/beta fold hydrolase [Hoyosella altamirensis]
MDVVRAHGIDIAYVKAGHGPSLVFVHGAAGDHRDWAPQIRALADEFTVIAWDEPGAGQSGDVPDTFVLADYAHCLATFIATHAASPACVVGLSWGGTLALELYRHHPDVVRRLVLADTYAGWKGSLSGEEVQARVAGVHSMLTGGGSPFDPTLPGLFAAGPPAEFAPLLADIAHDVRPHSMAHALMLMADTDQRDILPTIAVPTLLIWGDNDARSPLEQVGRQFERTIPGATLAVIPRCGHVSNLECHSEFTRLVRDFCAGGVPPPNRPGSRTCRS